MKDILNRLIEYKSLDGDTAKEILLNLAQGAYNQSQVAAFLTVYMMRSITVEELGGFRSAMLELCLPVDLSEFDPIDMCGTGGDGKDTFNISTLSSFVVGGAGYKVAKHGNNGVSSVCGSSNLLAHFGIEFTNDFDKLRKAIDYSNVCFLHAPLFHPAMKNVAPIRKELAVKTFFNMLGPMVNPAFPKKQLVGVFSLELLRLYAYLYQQEEGNRFAIVHSLDGYDEISLTGAFKMVSQEGEKVVTPADLGLEQVAPEELYGGNTVEEAAEIFTNVLNNKATKSQTDAVIANSGLGIYCSDEDLSLQDSIAEARESVESGEAKKCFERLLELS
jgi:anthranilate phosphoribosyltransferase